MSQRLYMLGDWIGVVMTVKDRYLTYQSRHMKCVVKLPKITVEAIAKHIHKEGDLWEVCG